MVNEEKDGKHPFDCQRCDAHPKSAFKIAPATKGWMIAYPRESLIHIHFGRATVTEEESTTDGEWAYENICNDWYVHNPRVTFFVAADFLLEDDAEFPSDRAMAAWKKFLQHPQTGVVVCYRTTTSMKIFVSLLAKMSRTLRKVKVVGAEREMEKEYALWLATNSSR